MYLGNIIMKEMKVETFLKSNKKCSGLRLLVRAQYPPPYGGISSLIASLVPGLRDYGCEDIAMLHYGEKNEVKTVDGTKIYCVNLKTHAWKILLPQNWFIFLMVVHTFKGAKLTFKQKMIETIKTLLVNKLAVKHKSNVVSFYQADGALELLPCRKKWGTTRGIVLTVFGEIYDNTDFIMARQPLFQNLIACPDAVLASSAYCACSFKKIGIERTIDVIYIGVSFERFKDDGLLRKQYRNELALTDERIMLLFMGRFHPEMGLDGLIASVPSLIKKHPTVKIILAGATGPLCNLALECQKNFPGHIKVINNVPFNLQPQLYAAADIVLTPSADQRACMGVTIKEAMMAGRPVIGTDSGGIPEAIIDGETGLLVPLQASGKVDNNALEEAITVLINNRDRRLEMGAKAKERAIELFGERVMQQRIADVFMRSIPCE